MTTLILRRMVSRRHLLATLLVLLAMGTMIRLGFWQLNRLDQRRAANAELAAALASEKIDLNANPPTDPLAAENRTVIARGEYDHAQQVILLVQNWSGRAGVHLITPLVLEGEETAVLVDRGWIPDTIYQSGDYGDYDTVGVVTVDGYGALSQTLSRYGDPDAQPEGPQSEFYRVDVERIGAQLPYELLPFYVRENPDGTDALPFRAERQVDLSEGDHLSYAVQWFSFTIILAVIYTALVRRNVQREAADDAMA
jgi:surfeit locus 1 family protein